MPRDPVALYETSALIVGPVISSSTGIDVLAFSFATNAFNCAMTSAQVITSSCGVDGTSAKADGTGESKANERKIAESLLVILR